MNRLSLEVTQHLPNVKLSRKYPQTVDMPIYAVGATFKGGKKGFDIDIWYDDNGAIEEVSITDLDDDGDWYRPNLSFVNMRTFEELKEVCRLLGVVYPENWP